MSIGDTVAEITIYCLVNLVLNLLQFGTEFLLSAQIPLMQLLVGWSSLLIKDCLWQGSFNSTGLIVSSKLPRFSDKYTLTVETADPKSISAKPKVEFTKSVTQWSLSPSRSPPLFFFKEENSIKGISWTERLDYDDLRFAGLPRMEFLWRGYSGKMLKP